MELVQTFLSAFLDFIEHFFLSDVFVVFMFCSVFSVCVFGIFGSLLGRRTK